MKRYGIILVGILQTTAASAQILDQGTLSIRQDGREIGREQFVIRPSRRGEEPGSTISTTARFGPADSGGRDFTAILRRNPGGGIMAFQYDLPATEATRRVLAATSDGRLTIRLLGTQAESARQWRIPAATVLLADSVYALFAAVAEWATPGGAVVTAIYPRTGQRIELTATRRESATNGGHHVDMDGGIRGTMRIDDRGHLQELMLPDAGVRVVRRPR